MASVTEVASNYRMQKFVSQALGVLSIHIQTSNEVGELTRAGTASVTQAGCGLAYFNRLFVQPTLRNQGLGTAIVRELQKELAPRNIGILCHPNPYDGEDRLPDLIRFYKRLGFTQAPDGALIWTPETAQKEAETT